MSNNGFRVTVTQFFPSEDPTENLEIVLRLISEASRDHPDLVTIPENFLRLGTPDAMREAAQSLDGPAVAAVRKVASDLHLAVYLGGFKRVANGNEKVRNSAVLIDREGEIAAVYDKVHLFDANIDNRTFKASSIEAPGTESIVGMFGEIGLGLSICYDVRFPEMYRHLALAGASIFLIPAAFLKKTGESHWEVLLRARAIENGAYVVAPALIGGSNGVFDAYGHAMVIDPWGRVLLDLGHAPFAHRTIALDLKAVDDARRQLPVLKQLQPHVYSGQVSRVDVRTASGPAMEEVS